MIEAEYTITYADYTAANRLFIRHRPWSMASYAFTLLVSASGVSLLIWALWLRAHGDVDSNITRPGMMLNSIWLALIFPLLRWIQLRRGYRNLFPKNSPKIARLSVNEEQVISAIPDRNEGRFYWKAIVGYAENKNGLILFVTRMRYLLVPHHALNEAQWTELRAMIAEKVANAR